MVQRDDTTGDLTAVVGDFGLATKIPDARFFKKLFILLFSRFVALQLLTHFIDPGGWERCECMCVTHLSPPPLLLRILLSLEFLKKPGVISVM